MTELIKYQLPSNEQLSPSHAWPENLRSVRKGDRLLLQAGVIVNSTNQYNNSFHTSNSSSATSSAASAVILIIFFLFLIGALVTSCCCVRRQDRIRDRSANLGYPSLVRGKPISREDRYTLIESRLLSLYVCEHTESCDVLTTNIIDEGVKSKNYDPEKTIDENLDVDRESDEGTIDYDNIESIRLPCCSICLDAFRVGDIVSISPSIKWCQCNHIFHHLCIKEWLLRHNTCPTCRAKFLPRIRMSSKSFNDSNQSENTTTSNSDTKNDDCNPCNQSETNNIDSFYCIQHGLVKLSCRKEVNKQTFLKIIPTKEELISLRGSMMMRSSTSISNHLNNSMSVVARNSIIPQVASNTTELTTETTNREQTSEDSLSSSTASA